MASDPMPAPLTNQEVKTEEEAGFAESARPRPELVHNAAPPTPADHALPRAQRREEFNSAVQEKLGQVKEAATRAKQITTETIQGAKEQLVIAGAEAKDRAADIYRESRVRSSEALAGARSRLNDILDQYPLQFIAGVAAAAFFAGVLLRVWRTNRDA